ncbi:MAG: hypothetical protein ABR521_11440 [Gaiellaceae bacterium]
MPRDLLIRRALALAALAAAGLALGLAGCSDDEGGPVPATEPAATTETGNGDYGGD